MVPAQPTPYKRLTYADYCQIPDDGKRHEIIDGIHYVSPAPRYIHQQIVVNLVGILNTWTKAQKTGVVLVAPFDVLLSEYDIVQPDVLFISNENRGILNEKNAKGAPDIAVEVLSPSNPNYDRELKLRRYERFDVKEYWIVDPETEKVSVYRLVDERYQEAVTFLNEPGNTLTSAHLPGLEIGLSDIFYRP